MTEFMTAEQMRPLSKFGSIAETEVPPGGRVVCCSVRDDADNGTRFTVGRVYTVVGFCGGVGVEGNRHGKSFGKMGKWLIPFKGFGAEWAAA